MATPNSIVIVNDDLIERHRSAVMDTAPKIIRADTHNGVSVDRAMSDRHEADGVQDHDLQVRNRWASPNDLAIWDNRSVYHTATFDYDGPRTGQRAVSLGESPYLDPQSVGRREALAQTAPATS